MRFGLYSSIANPPRGEHLDRCIDEVIAEAQLAEASGFDSCFFGEHHQDHDGFLPSPLIVATAVAARTQRLRVGTSVILLPLHHPVRVAEDVITLDLVSKGRVVLGVGIGYQPADFRAFARAHGATGGALRGERGDPAPVLGGRAVLVPGQALHARGRADPPAAVSRSRGRRCGSAAACPRPPAGPAASPTRSWARRAPAWRTRARSPTSTQDAAREAGRPARGHPDARRVGGGDAGRGRGRVRPAGHDGVPLLLAESPGGVPGACPRTRSSRWRISRPIASSSATPRRACASSSAGRRRRGRTTFLLRLRHAHSGRPAARQDHGGDPAVRRARAALLLGRPAAAIDKAERAGIIR